MCRIRRHPEAAAQRRRPVRSFAVRRIGRRSRLRNEPDGLIGRDGYLPSHLNLPPAMRFAAPYTASLAHTSSTVAEPRGALTWIPINLAGLASRPMAELAFLDNGQPPPLPSSLPLPDCECRCLLWGRGCEVPSDDVVQFGGWRRPPRWVWAVAGVAAVAALVGVVVARTGPHRAAGSSTSRPPTTAASSVPGSVARWPSVAGACGSTVDVPQVHLARQHADVHGWVLVGGAGLREVSLGGAVSGPLPGMPDHGQLVTGLVAGPGAAYAFDIACSSSSPLVKVYRIGAGAAHWLGITADDLLGGPHHVWAVTYRPGAVLTQVLSPLTGGSPATVKSSTAPVADTAAGLVVVPFPPPEGPRERIELVDPNTGAVLRRLGQGVPMGAAGHTLLVSMQGCSDVLTQSTCTLETVDLNTGRPATAVELPTGRVPVSNAVFSPDGTLAAFQLARARLDPRFAAGPSGPQDPRMGAGSPGPPSDVVVLHVRTGRLDIVPGLELPPLTWAGLAFDATGSWLLATVSEGDRGELLAWRQRMPGPALVASLPGPLLSAPPLLPAPSWWRTWSAGAGSSLDPGRY
jgi:hypothetical protein